jgi:peptidyl-prolyl cis-trans isomerase D
MTIESGHKPVLHKKHVARLQREEQQSRIILFAFVGILAAVLLLLSYGYLDINYLQLQRPVAKVGNANILVKQFVSRVRLQRQQLLGQYDQYSQYGQLFGMDVKNQLSQIEAQLNAPETLGQTVLDQLINEQLIRQEAKKRGITVSNEEIAKLQHDSFRYYPNGTPTPLPTSTEVVMPKIPPEAFTLITATPIPSATATLEATPTATLEPQATATAGPTSTPEPTATPYTQQGFESRFKDSQTAMMKLGLKEQEYLDLYYDQLLQTKVEDAITVDVPRVEKQVWARHILVADEASANKIIERLNNGEDFATLARELSTDTGSGAKGGDLDWFGAGAMVKEFETAAFALEKTGDYTTTPVKSQFGYHIIQLIAKQDRPLTESQYSTAKAKAFQDWLTAARKEYGVETYDIWKQHIPDDPNFVTIATDSAVAQLTAQAEITKTATTAP